MTVAELRDELESMPGHAEVWVWNCKTDQPEVATIADYPQITLGGEIKMAVLIV